MRESEEKRDFLALSRFWGAEFQRVWGDVSPQALLAAGVAGAGGEEANFLPAGASVDQCVRWWNVDRVFLIVGFAQRVRWRRGGAMR